MIWEKLICKTKKERKLVMIEVVEGKSFSPTSKKIGYGVGNKAVGNQIVRLLFKKKCGEIWIDWLTMIWTDRYWTHRRTEDGQMKITKRR